MAYNFNQGQNQFNSAQPPAQQNFQNNAMPQYQQQNVQPLFPQPQGNVYNINSTLEVANVPVGAGISVALCLQEGTMYIKTMQNGNPMFYAYKITPYDNTAEKKNEQEVSEDPTIVKFEQYDSRFNNLEKQIEEIKRTITENKKKESDWKV